MNWKALKKHPLGRYLYSFLKAGDNMVNHDGIEHAGYLAFLGLLAFFPFLVFLVALVGFLGQSFISFEMLDEIILNLPGNVGEALRPRMMEILSGPSQGLLTVAILGAVWTASSALEGLRTVLNRAYRVHTPPSYLLRRLLSIIELIILTCITITGLALLVVWPLVWTYLQEALAFDALQATGQLKQMSYIIAAFLLFFVVSALYYVLPNIKQTWISLYPGAAVVVAGWFGVAQLLSYYLSHFEQVNLIYGSLGGIIAVLLFFYLLAIIFIYGAELNYLLKMMAGEKVEEKEEMAVSAPLQDED